MKLPFFSLTVWLLLWQQCSCDFLPGQSGWPEWDWLSLRIWLSFTATRNERKWGDQRGGGSTFKCWNSHYVSYSANRQQGTSFYRRWKSTVSIGSLLLANGAEELDEKTVGHNDHVIVIGHRISRQLLTSSLRTLSISTVVLEMNSDNVAVGKERSDPFYHVDAASQEAQGMPTWSRAGRL